MLGRTLYIYIAFLILIPSVLATFFPIDLSDTSPDKLISPGLTTGAMLLAAVSLLIAVFDARNLKGTEDGKPFRVLIYMLCGALIASFFVGTTSLLSGANDDGGLLLISLPYIFIAAVYTVIVGVVGAIYFIVDG